MEYILILTMIVACPVGSGERVYWECPEIDVVNTPVCYTLPEFPDVFEVQNRIEDFYLKPSPPCECRGHRGEPKCDVPEPSTVVLMAIGGIVLVWMRLTRKRG
jgi:hypothetical protein